MVVLAIMVVIMSIVLTNQSSFNKTLILANTAYDIALTLRSAETYGLSSRASAVSTNTGYGIHFQSGTQGSFVFFADTSPVPSCSTPDCKPGDYIYMSGSDVLVQTYVLGNRMVIQDFCAESSGSWSCSSTGALSSLDIVFSRPNPDARMSKNGSYSVLFPVTRSCLTLASPQGGSRFVSVSASGAITANAPSCP